MVKRIIGITIGGVALSVVLIKIGLLAVLSTVSDTILRLLSPLGVTFTAREFAHIMFAALTTAVLSYFVWTGKIKFDGIWNWIKKTFRRFSK